MDAWEATANTAAGSAINWIVLAVVFGEPVKAAGVTLAMIALTWVRSYGIRKVFRWLSA